MAMVYFTIIFLHCITSVVSKQLLVTGKNNTSVNILGYSSYKNYAVKVEKLLSDKIRDTYNFALQHSDTSPSVLLSRTTPEKLVFLQLLHSFDLKSYSFTNLLVHISNYWSFNPSQAFKDYIDNNFAFPLDRVYQIIKFVAQENPELPKAISEQLFFLNIKYKVFENAAISGDVETVKWLLMYGVWGGETVDSTIIEETWKKGKIRVIELLMEYGKVSKHNLPTRIVNERYDNNETLLHVASRCGFVDIVIILIADIGASIKPKDYFGKTSLYRAVENNKYLIAETLINKGADVVHEPLLALAVERGYVETVETLLKLNVSPSINNEKNESPLFLAVERNNVKILNILLNIKDHNKLMLNSTNKFGETIMHIASHNGFIDSVKALVIAGFPVDHKNIYGETPLLKAIDDKNFELVQFLIESGADIMSRTEHGNTILHLAASFGSIEIVKYLLSDHIRFPIDVENTIGETPLYKAALSGNCDTLKFLVDKGGDIARNNDGFTMLHIAAAEGNERAVVCLIDSGLKVDVAGLWGITPLSVAVTQGHERVVERLLEKKANPNAKTKNLWTPLHRAVISGRLNIIRTLIKHSADLNSKNDKGLTPLLLAVDMQQVAAAELIRSMQGL